MAACGLPGRRTLFFALLLAWTAGCQSTPPEVYGTLGDFSLTDAQSNRPVTRDDLKGKVWLAAFIFTRCGNTCPQFTRAMATLQKDLEQQNDFRLVSITIDPENDTPEVLRDYAKKFGADPSRWLFLTGDKAAIHRLSMEEFKLGLDENQGAARSPGNEFMHRPTVVLVDKQGQIRGYFDLREESALTKVRKQVPYLVREKS